MPFLHGNCRRVERLGCRDARHGRDVARGAHEERPPGLSTAQGVGIDYKPAATSVPAPLERRSAHCQVVVRR